MKGCRLKCRLWFLCNLFLFVVNIYIYQEMYYFLKRSNQKCALLRNVKQCFDSRLGICPYFTGEAYALQK